MEDSRKEDAGPSDDQVVATSTGATGNFGVQGAAQVATASGGANPNVKTVEEFQYLLEKSQQLFAGLRDLPPTGKNWQPYFQRTFEPYFGNVELYGLKRWEIGEIASKIGQLYYHYYLRTSETNYLYESYVFYEAIRDRQYFRDVMEAKSPALMIKKLRYYARFIVVCLLLNRNDVIKKLMEELTTLVDDYTKTFKPNDSAEWNIVLSEISTFLEAEKKLTPVESDARPSAVQSRLQLDRTPKFDKDGQPKLKLQEAILVGNYQSQIKFSELTLDMYRVLQTLEREPTAPGKGATPMEPPMAEAESNNGEGDKTATRRTNPHKYLLFTDRLFAQLMLYIATAFKDISENSALLLYVSADGAKRPTKPDSSDIAYSGSSLVHCLHPNDLIPFSRKPLFLIVDSTNSVAFKVHTTQIGSLFTLFLHSPVKAFSFVSDAVEMSAETWKKCASIIVSLEKLIYDLLEASTTIDKSVKRFLQDDFLRQITIRFVLSSILLQSHSSFKEPKYCPSSFPALPRKPHCSLPELSAKFQELCCGSQRVGTCMRSQPEASITPRIKRRNRCYTAFTNFFSDFFFLYLFLIQISSGFSFMSTSISCA
ncbi:hypothetical protein BC829DRAFT_395937 [Chytridium lagenaria]|nr:hypothetical protein BC829DRAFT_395937 [Chytridium lagenaria]